MTVARALRRSADELRHYAHKLQHAHEHHGWSLGRLVTLGRDRHRRCCRCRGDGRRRRACRSRVGRRRSRDSGSRGGRCRRRRLGCGIGLDIRCSRFWPASGRWCPSSSRIWCPPAHRCRWTQSPSSPRHTGSTCTRWRSPQLSGSPARRQVARLKARSVTPRPSHAVSRRRAPGPRTARPAPMRTAARSTRSIRSPMASPVWSRAMCGRSIRPALGTVLPASVPAGELVDEL